MYSLPYFKEQDQDTILRFIKENPFAFLCGCDESNKPVATQVPVFIDEKDGKLFLSGHVMKIRIIIMPFCVTPMCWLYLPVRILMSAPVGIRIRARLLPGIT